MNFKFLVFLTVFVEKPNKCLEFTDHTLVLVQHNHIMVYSNAVYFASHFNRLTEVLYTFNEKQKSDKNIKLNKTTLAKMLFALRGKGHPEKLD